MTAASPSTTPLRLCTPRFATPRRPDRPTFGGELAVTARALGQPFMPWQRMISDVAGEFNPETGVPYYREVIVTVPRQSGKTTLFLSFQCHRCLNPRWSQPQRSAFTAQTGKDARDKWLDELFPLIRESQLNRFVLRMNEGMGNESIRWRNGSLIRILSTSNSSGHSKTLHQATLDELWHDTDARREQGLRPAMITIPDAQLLVCSTKGTHLSTVLQRKVVAGRKAVAADTGRGIAYFEFSAPDDWDPFDDESYYSFHPALCPDPPCRCGDGKWRHTQTIDAILTERDGMPLDDFKRAYGNVEAGAVGGVIDKAAWDGLADPESKRTGDVTVGVDMSPMRDVAAIGLYGTRKDGLGHGQLMDCRPGSTWIVGRMVELRASLDPVAFVMGKATYEALKTDLERAGFAKPAKADEPERGDLAVMTGPEMGASAGNMLDAVKYETFRHLGQMELDDSACGAKVKPSGDSLVWVRNDANADTPPIVALSEAKWGHEARAHLLDDYDVLDSVPAVEPREDVEVDDVLDSEDDYDVLDSIP